MTQPRKQVEPAPMEPPLIGQATQVSIAGLVFMIMLGIFIADRSRIADSIAGNRSLPDRDPYQAAVTIDINAATPRELTLLPGVGPVLADRILANRDRLGQFQTIDELDRVYGVGARTIDQIDRFVVVGGSRRVAAITAEAGAERAQGR